MSPHRRKTRGSLATDVQAALKPLASKDLAVRRTRSGHQSATQSPSPSKTNKSPKQSPLKQQKLPHVSSPRKSLIKPCSSKKVPNTPGKTPRTPQKSPKRSPVKSKNNSPYKATSGNVLMSKIKKEPQSPSQSAVEVNNLKTKVVKIEPESPSKTTVPEGKCTKTTPKSSGSKLVCPNVHESSPSHLRITRGTSAASSPVSAKRNASKSSLQKFSKVINSHLEEESSDGLKMQSPSSRKRHLPTLSSPRSTKIRRARGKVLISMHTNDATSSEQESSVVDDVRTGESITSGLPLVTQKSNPQTLTDSDSPELNSRFMRRKWFSLKTRGGFTCLRSAVLTPQEIAQEILQKTMTDTSQATDSNFFTTKLMVRLSSKLPPVRARPSCEELVDLINSKQMPKKIELIADPKVEGTALRVKVEKRSLSDTITHVTRNPPQIKPAGPIKSNKSPKGIRKPASPVKFGTKIQAVVNFGERSLTKKQERDIALRQLKNLKNL